VQWVPYSCALESFDGVEAIRFNDDPKLKVLQLGHVGWSYPFRQYVAGLNDPNIEHLAHPGWNHDGASQAVIRIKYYEYLNQYICCFSDALIYRYIVAKNFEIPAVGALLLTDKIIEKEMNTLGFIDYETCIFCEKETFLDKVNWILDPSNRAQVDEIRRAGMRLVSENHMTRHRAAQIVGLVKGKNGRENGLAG
jgi:Glycosyl transferases group 1